MSRITTIDEGRAPTGLPGHRPCIAQLERLQAAAVWMLTTVACLLMPSTARAEDPIPTVTIGASGPDRAFPLDGPFRVKGKGKLDEKVEQVDIVFVRYWSRPFGAQPPRKALSDRIRSCAEVHEALEARAFKKVTPGEYRIEQVWDEKPGTTPPDLHQLGREERVLVVAPWTRANAKSDDEKKTFDVLVDDAAWFLPGARYCALVYERKKEVKAYPKLMKVLEGYGNALEPSIVPGTDLDPVVSAAVSTFLNQAVCIKGSSDPTKRCQGANEQRVPVEDKEWKKIEKVYKASGHNAVYALLRNRRAFQELAGCWNAQVLPNPPPAPPTKITLRAAEPDGLLVLELAALAGGVTRGDITPRDSSATPPTPARQHYLTNDKKFVISEIEIIRDLTNGRLIDLRIASDTPANSTKTARLGLNLSKLIVGGSDVTAEEILLFMHGTVIEDGKVVGISDMLRRPLHKAWPESPAQLTSIRRLGKIYEVLTHQPVAGLSDIDHRMLIGRLGVTHYDVVKAKDYVDEVCNGASIPANAPRYRMTPMGTYLVEVADEYENVVKQWVAFKGTAKVSLETVTPRTTPLVTKGYTQESFISDYVTPVQGFAGVVTAEGEAFFLPYLGVQIYFSANPVDRPMWTRGARKDMARFASLELGVAEQVKPMGPQGRFQGFGGGRFPPVMAGVGLQLAPWLTFSQGLTVLERRRSEFAGERHEVVVRYFFSGTVQLNVPGLIKRLSGAKRTTNETK